MTSTDGCRNPNSASQDFSYATFTNIITRSGEYADFSLVAQFAYYSLSDLTNSAERIEEQKEIKFRIRVPLTHVVTVTAPFQLGAALLYDITSHGILEESGEQVVFVGFRTFLNSGHSFTGACSISSPYFNDATAECTAGASETFD